MTIDRLKNFYFLSMLLACATAWGGPAEIEALERKLAAVKAQIEDGQDQLRRALSGYGGDPGEEGAQLRALKIQRSQTQAELNRALADERQRSATDRAMPSAGAMSNTRRQLERRQKPPVVESAPVGTPLPAPTL